MMDLVIQFLYQSDVENEWCFFFYFIFFGYGFENWYFCVYVVNEFIGYWFIDCDQIFFFMVVVGVQDFVYQIVMVGEEDQFLGVFIQMVDRKDMFVVVDEIDNVVVFVIFGGVYNVDWFIQCNQYQIICFVWFN